MKQSKLLLLAIFALLSTLILGYNIHTLYADGIPKTNTLSYSGLLEEDGVPVADSSPSVVYNIVIQLFKDATGTGTAVCTVSSPATSVIDGRFRIAMDTCVEAVKGNPELWLEPVVNGSSLGLVKLGAVPYAIEANRASEAGGNLKQTLDSKASNSDLDLVESSLSADIKGVADSVTKLDGRVTTLDSKVATIQSNLGKVSLETKSCQVAGGCTVSCTSGKYVVGGGCDCGSQYVTSNWPNSASSWFCRCNSGTSVGYAICATPY